MFNFMKYKFVYLIFSGTLVLLSTISLLLWQVKPSIDFTGGALLEIYVDPNVLQSKSEQKAGITTTLSDQQVELSSLQESGSNNWIIRMKTIDEAKKIAVLAALSNLFPITNGGSVREE